MRHDHSWFVHQIWFIIYLFHMATVFCFALYFIWFICTTKTKHLSICLRNEIIIDMTLHYTEGTRASWRLKSPATQLLIQTIVQANNKQVVMKIGRLSQRRASDAESVSMSWHRTDKSSVWKQYANYHSQCCVVLRDFVGHFQRRHLDN